MSSIQFLIVSILVLTIAMLILTIIVYIRASRSRVCSES